MKINWMKIFYTKHMLLLYYFLLFWETSPGMSMEDSLFIQLNTRGYYFPDVQFNDSVIPGPAALLDTIFWKDEGNKTTIIIGEILNKNLLNQIIVSHLKSYINNGFLLADIRDFRYISGDIRSDTLHLNAEIEIKRGPKIVLADVIFPGADHTNPSFLRKVVGFRRHMILTPESIKRMENALNRLDFVSRIGEISLREEREGFIMAMPLQEKKMVQFDLLIGYAPQGGSRQDRSRWAGRIFFDFKNLFGSGRRMQIHWERLQQQIEKFALTYQERFLFGTPFHLQGNYSSLYRDSLYSTSEKGILLQYEVGNSQFGFRYRGRSQFVDSLLSTQLSFTRTSSREVALQWIYHTYDIPLNPSGGFAIQLEGSAGTVWFYGGNADSSRNRISFSGDISTIFPVSGLHIFQQFRWEKIFMQNTIPVTELIFVGGSRNFRGAREDEFRTPVFGLWTTEIRFRFNRYSRFSFFYDWLYFEENGRKRTDDSYGLGLLFPTGAGQIELNYALRNGFDLQNGVLHLRLVSEF